MISTPGWIDLYDLDRGFIAQVRFLCVVVIRVQLDGADLTRHSLVLLPSILVICMSDLFSFSLFNCKFGQISLLKVLMRSRCHDINTGLL